jgi:hypothetical protein
MMLGVAAARTVGGGGGSRAIAGGGSAGLAEAVVAAAAIAMAPMGPRRGILLCMLKKRGKMEELARSYILIFFTSG